MIVRPITIWTQHQWSTLLPAANHKVMFSQLLRFYSIDCMS